MKLLRLKLENWRGVDFRELEFASGVTLIEGPNEIGKSTIVEAIQNLFTVMDSSSRTDIKAVQPVGKDVGSSVEVEAEVGNYHFIYRKTYNKNKQTELRVLTPQPEQLTGREAHERAEQILEESVDMVLWSALLVEQGNEIAGVTLSQSNGLARALDEAAGGESPEQDDSDLFARVQAEYENHFTLKTGKQKYLALESELNEARSAMDSAKASLAEVETDSDNHERCMVDIRRLEIKLPELQKEEDEHGASWQAIREKKDKVSAKQDELETARQLLQAASNELERRQDLVKGIDEGAQELNEAREQLNQESGRVAELKKSAHAANEALNEAKKELKKARTTVELARADRQHLQNAVERDSVNKNLKHLQQYNAKRAAARTALQGIKIDPDGLEELRKGEGELQVALAKLDTATSSIEVVAEDELVLSLNDEAMELSAGQVERRDIAAELEVAIPGVARILVMPSQSASELEADVDDRKEALGRLLKKHAVKDLADAVAVETKRAANEQEAESWSEKIEELLDGETEADWQSVADDLKARCDDYAAHREADLPLPADVGKAEAAETAAEETLTACEETVEVQQDAWEELRDEYAEASAQHRVNKQEVSGLENVAKERQQDLEKIRAAADDQAVKRDAEKRTTAVSSLQIELSDLNEQLESASPEAAEVLFANAQTTRKRAAKDLAEQQRQLAVLEDRLTRAQADGRFDALDKAEHKLARLESEQSATAARAAAAKRLWEVLGARRHAARKVYVRPLKDGVEQLGKIVFGSDFAIELGDDWGLISRTQDGKTIPFDDLSVGAKEQLGILMRLAAARIVSSQGGVPLIIDDALGFSDPSRLKTMGAAIASAGNDCQVILLTCTPGRFTHVGNAQVVQF